MIRKLFTLTADIVAKLEALMQSTGKTRSAIVREAITRLYEEIITNNNTYQKH